MTFGGTKWLTRTCIVCGQQCDCADWWEDRLSSQQTPDGYLCFRCLMQERRETGQDAHLAAGESDEEDTA